MSKAQTQKVPEPQTCRQRLGPHLQGRIADIRKLWAAYGAGQEETDEGSIHEYGLSFDYVAAGTFQDQRVGYWRWQLSWGGPSDEFRFYADPGWKLTRIEYRFMDWWDGAGLELKGDDETLLTELWDWFEECGSVEAEFQKATREESR